MKFRDLISKLDEGINDNALPILIPMVIHLIGQAHIWHLLTKNAQQHTALNELYTTLQDEVDELAERYIALGGRFEPLSINFNTNPSEQNILTYISAFRDTVSQTISVVKEDDNFASILDGVVDIQECIDSFVYKFNLK